MKWVNDNYNIYDTSGKNYFKYEFKDAEERKSFLNVAKSAGFRVEDNGYLLNGHHRTKLTRKNKGYYDCLNLFTFRQAESRGFITTMREVYTVEYDREITDLAKFDETYARYVDVVNEPDEISDRTEIKDLIGSILVVHDFSSHDYDINISINQDGVMKLDVLVDEFDDEDWH